MDAFGRVDVLVNNAGIAPVPPSLAGITEALFAKTIDVNLRGPMRLTAKAAEHMPAGGAIINISSKASTHPSPTTVVYAAAKAGLNTFTQAAAIELAPRGIRVNGIICGTFMTDSLASSLPSEEAAVAAASRVLVGRIADPDEIVGTALYLATDASSYLNGQMITVGRRRSLRGAPPRFSAGGRTAPGPPPPNGSGNGSPSGAVAWSAVPDAPPSLSAQRSRATDGSVLARPWGE